MNERTWRAAFGLTITVLMSSCGREEAGTPEVSVQPTTAPQAQTSGSPRYLIRCIEKPLEIDGRLQETEWAIAESIDDFLFPWWKEGEKETTQARMLWDRERLYVSFVAQDRHISAVLTERDSAVSNEDCVEVFVAPDVKKVGSYFNFEVNALGTLLDRSQHEEHEPGWNAEGIQIAIAVDGTLNDETDEDRSWTVEIAIPFAVFEGVAANVPPKHGDEWRLNLYRCGGEVNAQYSVWSDTETPHPDYHVPERFGFVQFSESFLLSN